MEYKVEYTAGAVKTLRNIDKPIMALIYGWIEKNLVGCRNLRQHGKALVANHWGEWRYCVGGYRILAEIQDTKVTILIITIGYRKEIYK